MWEGGAGGQKLLGRRTVGVAIKGNLCGDESVLYLDCTNINTLVVIFGSCFTRYFHLGNLHKD